MNPRALVALIVFFALTLPATMAWGEFTKSDKKRAKQALAGTLYMRIDAPCATGRHSFGTYQRPLVEVSPVGTNAETDNVMTASWWHADSTYWGISINDAVQFDEFDVEDDEIEIELEGVDSNNSTVIKFVGIRTWEDFEKAFDQTFSRQPLQDQHDDWPAEIKQAIGERRLVAGMTKKQVFYITGTPTSFEKKEEDGKSVEIWNLRQNKGMKMGYWTIKGGETTGLPASIRFEDGKLVDVVQAGGSSEFSLDN